MKRDLTPTSQVTRSASSVRLYISKGVRWQYFGLLLLVVLSLGLHFSIINNPESYVFDEAYYVPDARSIIAQEGSTLAEHPPLGKLIIATGMRIFGDNPLGWRFFAVIFGVLNIVLLYFICRALGLSNRATLLVTIIFTLENLTFIQASIAMLDVYSLTFMLISLLLFLRSNLILAGIVAGLCILVKLPGIFILGIFFLYWLLHRRENWRLFVVPTTTAIISFIALLPFLEYAASGQFANPFLQIGYMIEHAGLLTFSDGNVLAASRPWDWLMNRGVIIYFHDPQYIAILSPTISAVIIPAITYMSYRAVKRNRAALFGLIWFVCTYIPWVIISLVSDRLTYIYYLFPVVGAICIGLGLIISQLVERNHKNQIKGILNLTTAGVCLYLILHLLIFIALSPMISPLYRWLGV
ncbi:MAG: phospholipid carrier-dependent glycosyltransferase [Dehalococcoidia bacterium]|nr:MAG: phospholipid carrier-dependent glycosyltransferase [Dehalococcoidia bacterium]